MSNPPNRPKQFDLVNNGEEIEKAFQRAVKSALFIHKKLGNSVSAWQDGKVVVIPPEEIPVDENDPEIDYKIALQDFAFVHGINFLKKLRE